MARDNFPGENETPRIDFGRAGRVRGAQIVGRDDQVAGVLQVVFDGRD